MNHVTISYAGGLLLASNPGARTPTGPGLGVSIISSHLKLVYSHGTFFFFFSLPSSRHLLLPHISRLGFFFSSLLWLLFIFFYSSLLLPSSLSSFSLYCILSLQYCIYSPPPGRKSTKGICQTFPPQTPSTLTWFQERSAPSTIILLNIDDHDHRKSA